MFDTIYKIGEYSNRCKTSFVPGNHGPAIQFKMEQSSAELHLHVWDAAEQPGAGGCHAGGRGTSSPRSQDGALCLQSIFSCKFTS